MTTTAPLDRASDEQDHRSDDAVLFDMDGVVLEGRGIDPAVHARALEDAMGDLDPECELDPDVRDALESYEYTSTFEAACERIDVDPVELYRRREEHSARRVIDRIRRGERDVYADVDAIDRVRDRCVTGLVSNNYDPAVSFVVDHFGLDAFSFVRGRDPGVDGFFRRKPNPYYLNEAIEALDAAGGYYVGDRVTDLIAAERAGLLPVFLRRPHNEDVDPELETYVELQSLSELPDLL